MKIPVDESGFSSGLGFGGGEPSSFRVYPSIRRVAAEWTTDEVIPCGSHEGLSFCDPDNVVTTAAPESTVAIDGTLNLPILAVPYCRVRGDAAYLEELGATVFPIGWNYFPVMGQGGDSRLVVSVRDSRLAGGDTWYPPVSEGAARSDFPAGSGVVDHWLPASRGFYEEMGLVLPVQQFQSCTIPLAPLFTYEVKRSWVLGAAVQLDHMGFNLSGVQSSWAGALDGDESLVLAPLPAVRAFLDELAPCLPWVRFLVVQAALALEKKA